MSSIVRCDFGFVSDDEVLRASAVEVVESSKKKAMRGSLSDPRMGVMERGQLCPTCRQKDCKGHFGHIPLRRAIWRTGAVGTTRTVYRSVCEWCARPRWLPGSDRLEWAKEKYRNEDGAWFQKPDRALSAVSAAFQGLSCCPWTADAMDELRGSEELSRLNREFDEEHGTTNAVLKMFDTPPCGLPMPQYRDQNKLFLYREWAGDAESALGNLPPLVQWKLRRPLRPEDTRDCFSRIGDYGRISMGFREGTSPRDLVTAVQVVPPPRMRITSFGSAEDDLTFFLREVLKANRHLGVSSEKLRLAMSRGTTDAQKECAAEMLSLSRTLMGLRDEKASLLEEGADTSAADELLVRNSESFYEAMLRQQASCAKEIREEEMLWKVLICRISDIVNPDATTKVEIPGAEKFLGGTNLRSKRNRHGLHKRMSGKQGRFRKTILGKRVNDSARSVIDPAPPGFDPYELGVPEAVARVLVVPEKVNSRNLERLRDAVRTGEGRLGGASMVFEPPSGDLSVVKINGGLTEGNTVDRGKGISLKIMTGSERDRFAADVLEPGYTVLRHLCDGDVVVFNRQPTLHRGSWMSFMARIVKTLSFQLPVVVTAPFNADFDGDEMNLHVPLSQHAQVEAMEIMFMPKMIRGAGNNSPRCGLIMGGNAAAFDMTRQDVFLDRSTMMQGMMHIRHDPAGPRYTTRPTRSTVKELFEGPSMRIPQPAVMVPRRRARREGLPEALWTGSQLFGMIVPRSVTMVKSVRGARGGGDLFAADGIARDDNVRIVGGQILHGRLCKKTVGASAGGLVDVISQTMGPWCTARFLGDAHRMTSFWIDRVGGSTVALSDCVAPRKLRKKVSQKVSMASSCVKRLVGQMGKASRTEIQSYVMKIFNRARQEIQRTVMEGMDERNDIWRMIWTGSKGKPANLSQIMGVVGAQTFNGGLPLEFFVPTPDAEGRKTDHVHGARRTFFFCGEGENSLESLGFAGSSFTSGLDIVPMLWQIAAGRVGLIDTAVKTSRVGYAFRTMYTGTNSNAIAADGTIRTSSNEILSFTYGDDGMDPERLEVVSFELKAECPRGLSQPLRDAWAASRDLMMSARVSAARVSGKALSSRSRQPFNVARMVAAAQSGCGTGVTPPGFVLQRFAGAETFSEVIVRAMAMMQESDPLRSLPPPASLPDVSAGFRSLWAAETMVADRTAGTRAYLLHELVGRALHLTIPELCDVVSSCCHMHALAQVGQGEAVGATAASSINEPLQQLTMNTFHSTGQTVAAVVSGLPAMKQVIDAHDTRETAQGVVYFKRPFGLSEKYANLFAQGIKSARLVEVVRRSECSIHLSPTGEDGSLLGIMDRLLCEESSSQSSHLLPSMQKAAKIGKTQLRKAISRVLGARAPKSQMKEVEESLSVSPSRWVSDIVLDKEAMQDKGVTTRNVLESVREFLGDDGVVVGSPITADRWVVRVRLRGLAALATCSGLCEFESSLAEEHIMTLMTDVLLQKLRIGGLVPVKAAVSQKVSQQDGTGGRHEEFVVKTVGTDLSSFLSLPGVDGTRTRTTNIVDIAATLGIEAAHRGIRDQLVEVLGENCDPRHLMHVADTMTKGGYLMGFQRDSMKPMTAGPIARIAFEETIRQLNVASSFGQTDPMTDIIASTVLGQKQTRIGTGAVSLLVKEEDDPRAAVGAREIVAPMEEVDLEEDDEDEDFVGFRSLLVNTDRVGELHALPDIEEDDCEGVPALDLSAEEESMADDRARVSPDPEEVVPGMGIRHLLWAEDDLQIIRGATGQMDPQMLPSIGRVATKVVAALPNVVELEVRMGRRAGGGFDSGVTRVQFARALERLDAYKSWDKKTGSDWEHTMDVFYEISGSPVRTTVAYRKDFLKRGQLPRSHIIKTRVASVDGSCSALEGDVRFAVSTETDIPVTSLPESIVPDFVRIKLRKSFTKGFWRYDLTQVWQGKDLVGAERSMMTGRPRYELEAECLAPDVMVGRIGFTAGDLAASALLRAGELCRAVCKDPEQQQRIVVSA